MARGRRVKSKLFKKSRDEEEKSKPELVKNEELKKLEKSSSRMLSYFKSEDLQEICALLNVEELDDHHCFLGAVVIGKFDVVKRLLKEGFCIDTLDENRETPLMHAVKHFRYEMVDFLVTRGADISLEDSEGNNAFLLAAQNTLWDQDSFFDLWNSVRDHPWLRPNHTNQAGYSLLHYITKRQWKNVLELLLNIPVTLDTRTSKGVTPLIMAASRGDATFVRALLVKGADFTVEDQQKCTALCYAIAFNVQKNVTDSKQTLELILGAVNDEHSKLPLETYLQRRLEVLVNPPKCNSEFSKTVTSVLIHVLTFFARMIYSGMDLLLELSVFHRLKEAIECHIEDVTYTTAVLAVVLELVRHSDQCCQEGLSHLELADAFFSAGLGKCCLDILNRYGTGKTVVIKAVFLPLIFICTSENYKARTWLETNHEFLQSYYNKYMRSFPAMFLETNGDTHLEIEKKSSLSFQKIMKALKAQGQIVTEEEHSRASLKLKEDTSPAHSPINATKSNNTNVISNPFKSLSEINSNKTCTKRIPSKPLAVYNSIIQCNFGKLDIIKEKRDSLTEVCTVFSNKQENSKSPQSTTQSPPKEKKSRIAIKEIQTKQTDESSNEKVSQMKDIQQSKEVFLEEYHLDSSSAETEKKHLFGSNVDLSKKSPVKQEINNQFSDGYQLFKIEEELESGGNSEEENSKNINISEWLDTFTSGAGNKSVSDMEVANTMNYLEEIFNRIVQRYDSTWKKQFEEGYLGAEGDSEDLLKLMIVLPALENYHMEKLTLKWNKFCKQVQDHARKNHLVYAAMVSEMQLFLLEFEAELDKKDVKIFNDNANASLESYLETEKVLKSSNSDINVLSNGRPVENLINTVSFLHLPENVATETTNLNDNTNSKTAEFTDNINISDTEQEEDNLNTSIWDAKVKVEPVQDFDRNPKKCNTETEQVSTVKERVNVLNEKDETPNEKEDSVSEARTIEASKNILTTNEKEQDQIINICERFISTSSLTPLQKLFETCSAITHSHDSKMQLTKTENRLTGVINTSSPKPPPGFKNFDVINACFMNVASVLKYSGTKYQALSLALVALPACKTELLERGNLRLASIEYQMEFKLFDGYNFGNVELGLSSTGVPLAVRRFEKHNTQCNTIISKSLYHLIGKMLSLKHEHILPYVACYDQPSLLVYAIPLCYLDLGQYLRHVRAVLNRSPDNLLPLSPKLLTMSEQVMSGLHYLHTQDSPVVHGNLKPSNILVDANGNLLLAEFGVHEVLFQQQGPALTSMIWWSREIMLEYHNTRKFVCTQQSDIQTAGMLLYFIMTIGQHPYGLDLDEIIVNIKNDVILINSEDVISMDLVYWMLSHNPDNRPSTSEALRHMMFWSTSKRWGFLKACCGLGPKHKSSPLPLDQLYNDLDFLGKLKNINTKWISVLKYNCELKIGRDIFEDKPSGLLKFLNKNLHYWSGDKAVFLELFPVLPLNLFRLLEQTVWIDHPEFEPFTRIDSLI